MLDVDAFRVDAERRGRAFEEAVRAVGPTDGAVVLKVSTEYFSTDRTFLLKIFEEGCNSAPPSNLYCFLTES